MVLYTLQLTSTNKNLISITRGRLESSDRNFVNVNEPSQWYFFLFACKQHQMEMAHWSTILEWILFGVCMVECWQLIVCARLTASSSGRMTLVLWVNCSTFQIFNELFSGNWNILHEFCWLGKVCITFCTDSQVHYNILGLPFTVERILCPMRHEAIKTFYNQYKVAT